MNNYFPEHYLLNILHGAWNSYSKRIAPCEEETQSLYSVKSFLLALLWIFMIYVKFPALHSTNIYWEPIMFQTLCVSHEQNKVPLSCSLLPRGGQQKQIRWFQMVGSGLKKINESNGLKCKGMDGGEILLPEWPGNDAQRR